MEADSLIKRSSSTMLAISRLASAEAVFSKKLDDRARTMMSVRKAWLTEKAAFFIKLGGYFAILAGSDCPRHQTFNRDAPRLGFFVRKQRHELVRG